MCGTMSVLSIKLCKDIATPLHLERPTGAPPGRVQRLTDRLLLGLHQAGWTGRQVFNVQVSNHKEG